MWESLRYEWRSLGAMQDAAVVPNAINKLLSATSESDAEWAGGYIENNVVVQGALYNSAPATAACLVVALPFAPKSSRFVILDLLLQLCGGNASEEEVASGDLLRRQCLTEICKGITCYFYLLQYGSSAEQWCCVDLLDACGEFDNKNVNQIVWYLAKLRETELESDFKELVDNTIRSLSRHS